MATAASIIRQRDRWAARAAEARTEAQRLTALLDGMSKGDARRAREQISNLTQGAEDAEQAAQAAQARLDALPAAEVTTPHKRPRHAPSMAATSADKRQAWRGLRPDALEELAATMTTRQIGDLFGVSSSAAFSRLAYLGLTAQPSTRNTRRTLVHDRLIPCTTTTTLGTPCGAPLEPDGTCRWAHQHTA
jgi:hypothetical protein